MKRKSEKHTSEIVQVLAAEKRPNPQLRERLFGGLVLGCIGVAIGSFWLQQHDGGAASATTLAVTETVIPLSIGLGVGMVVMGNRYAKIGDQAQAAPGMVDHALNEIVAHLDITAADPTKGFTDGPNSIELIDLNDAFNSQCGYVVIASQEQIS